MRRLLLALLLALCAGRAPAETREDLYWRLHRERNPTTRYGAAPRTSATNSLRFLEYVEFNEHQIVDLGYVFTPRDKIEVDWQFTNVGAKQQRVFSQRANPGLHIELYINSSGQYGYAYERDNLSGWKGVSRAIQTTRSIYGLDGPNGRMYNGSLSWTIPALGSMTDAECGTGNMFLSRNLPQYTLYARCYGCKLWKSGILVRDYHPAKDANGIACLVDFVSGECSYSATETPLGAGPEQPITSAVDMTTDDIRAWLAPPPGSGEVSDGDLWLDCLAIPEGNWLCECPIAGTTNTAWRAALCPSNILRAVVWRHAEGLAPTNLPVTLEHDPSRVIGRIERLFYEAGTGVVARISVTQSGYAWAVSNHCAKPSPDVRCFTSGTNVAIRTDGWTYEHQDYLDNRVVPMLQRDGSARSLAELETFTTLTNVPANVEAIVMAPIYFRGLSLVETPLLPTYLESEVPENLRHAYPIRPPRQWTWRNGD